MISLLRCLKNKIVDKIFSKILINVIELDSIYLFLPLRFLIAVTFITITTFTIFLCF